MTAGTLHNASWLVSDRTVGASQGAFAFNNVAIHVGDDPDAVAANRRHLADRIRADALVFSRAAHSDQAAYVTGPTDDVPGVDALFTDIPGLAVAAQGADCVPLGIATADGWVAAIHCGWRGLVAGIVPHTLAAMRAVGSDLTGALAHLGPSICPDCYPVGQDCFEQVAEVVPQAAVRSNGRTAVDVRAGVVEQLRRAGIPATWDPRCTAEDPGLYSHRRDGRTGRQALVIVRQP